VKQPFVYILASKPHGTLYIGVTSDPIARLYQHRTDQVKGFTSRYGVHMLVHYEQFESMYDAISPEKQLKRWHRQWKINLMRVRIRTGTIWRRRWDCHRSLVSDRPSPVILNSFQDPTMPSNTQLVRSWMLKQVQHDRRGRARLYWPLAK
jgi:putative endonuclease